MLRLHGVAISNHYNKVKLALLEKGVAFEEVSTPPSQEAALLAFSPMGKVPYLEVDGCALAESQAIAEYLEDTYPSPALLPKDPWARAKVRELINVLELYVKDPAFRVLAAAFFGAPLSEETKKEVRAQLQRGATALARVAKFDPYIAGKEFTLADCAAFNHLQLVAALGKMIYGEDVLAPVAGAAKYIEFLSQRPSCVRVNADRDKAMAAFMAARK